MKLLRSERPGISFFAKVVQLLALKCGTGLMFPEKNCCVHRPKRIEARRVETKTKRSGSRFRGSGRTVHGKTTMNQRTGKAIIQLILHYVLFI